MSELPFPTRDELDRARALIEAADAVLLTAGAGFGVDSGLPDFRGNEGFWRAYPPFRKLGLAFEDLADPRWFRSDPALAWGFYGHRLELYRATTPHEGFARMKRLAERLRLGAFVYTSNVDGQFQRAGFDDEAVCECHGSIHHLQCTRHCGVGLFEAAGQRVSVDPETFRAREPFPKCPACGALARPAILMFGDGDWDDARTMAQGERMDAFLARVARAAPGKLLVLEAGAGTAIPTVRSFSETCAARHGALVRINVREPALGALRGKPNAVGLAGGARAVLEALLP